VNGKGEDLEEENAVDFSYALKRINQRQTVDLDEDD